jgi:hypothetical protein
MYLKKWIYTLLILPAFFLYMCIIKDKGIKIKIKKYKRLKYYKFHKINDLNVRKKKNKVL